MISTLSHRRVLLLSASEKETAGLFETPQMAGWKTLFADNSGAAALALQSLPCDLLLAGEAHYEQEGFEGINWLVRRTMPPIVLMADLSLELVAQAYERGVSLWLPRRETLAHPSLFAAALQRAASWADLQARHKRSAHALDQTRRQVDRLVTMLWRVGPLEVEKRWYTHRHMLERLDEEVARAKRHDTPLTVALGEVQAPSADKEQSEDADLLHWTASQLTARKRRSDVAGQYGLTGFMLLMAHTATDGGQSCCRRLQQHIEAESDTLGAKGPIRAYFGLSSFSKKVSSAQRLLRYAEEDLEAAKHEAKEYVHAG